MAILVRRLEERDEVENFDCGDEPLNNYVKRHAWSNQEKSLIGVSYVAVDEGTPQAVLGYFTRQWQACRMRHSQRSMSAGCRRTICR